MGVELIVSRTSSKCGGCGHPCDPRETHHFTVLPCVPYMKGCGELFSVLRTDYLGSDVAVRELRPDLPLAAPRRV